MLTQYRLFKKIIRNNNEWITWIELSKKLKVDFDELHEAAMPALADNLISQVQFNSELNEFKKFGDNEFYVYPPKFDGNDRNSRIKLNQRGIEWFNQQKSTRKKIIIGGIFSLLGLIVSILNLL